MLYDTLHYVTDKDAGPWQERYPTLADEVRDVLRHKEKPLTTTQVVKLLLDGLPKEQADPHTAALYSILGVLAKHDLKDWVRPSEKLTRAPGGRMVHNRMWAAPVEAPTAPSATAAPARPVVQEETWWALGKWVHRHIADLTEEQRQSCEAVMHLMQEVNEETNTHD